MLEVLQWFYSTTIKPIATTLSSLAPTTTQGSFITERDDWGNNVESYRVDQPPHLPGLSLQCSIQ